MGQGEEIEEGVGRSLFCHVTWRGRKLWLLVCAASLAAVLLFTMIWVLPTQENEAGRASSPGMAVTKSGEETQADSGPAQEGDTRDDGESPMVTPGGGGNTPGVTVDFPDPAGEVPEDPPPGGYRDIHGRWVLDMAGSAYGLTNCHIIINDDGTISSPPDYEHVFQMLASSYRWQDGDRVFSASLQLILKMGSGAAAVPVRIELSGIATDALVEIEGDFSATPQGEAYAPYSQSGTFRMYR